MNYQEVLQILFENKNDQRAIFNAKIIKSKIPFRFKFKKKLKERVKFLLNQ